MESDAQLINRAGRQRMLSQKIVKLIFLEAQDSLLPTSMGYYENEVDKMIEVWQESHSEMMSNTSYFTDKSKTLDSLFTLIDPEINLIASGPKQLMKVKSQDAKIGLLNEISRSERRFLDWMDLTVGEYQHISETKLKRTKAVNFWVSLLSLVILVCEFIFILKPLFKRLQLRNKQLETNNQRLSDFAQIVSHNFRAPVGNIKMLLDLFKDTENTEEKSNLLDKIYVSTTQLSDTLDVLTDSLSIQFNREEPWEIVEFHQVMHNVLEQLEGAIQKTGAVIKTDFSELSGIKSNSIFLESIFLNLTSNAIKYQSPDRKLVLSIRSYEKSGLKHLEFSDNGLGIDLEKHGKKVFGLNKVFHRHPNAKGIGLFITRTHVESLGGSISVDSEVDKGTTFKITF